MGVGKVLGANLKFKQTLRQGAGLGEYLQALAVGLRGMGEGRKTTVRVFPHDLALIRLTETPGAVSSFAAAGLEIGAQDIHPVEDGSFTRAPLSASDLHKMGVRNVLIGHSEARFYFGVTDKDVADKLEAALKMRLFATACIGENIVEKDAGQTKAAIERQVGEGIVNGLRAAEAEDTGTLKLDIAYEPVWAIEGFARKLGLDPRKAKNSDIIMAHEVTREVLLQGGYPKLAEAVRIAYGGSAKPVNAEELVRLVGVDGLLVGTAAWEAASFLLMIAAAERVAAG